MAENIRVIAVPDHLAEELERALAVIRDEMRTASPDARDSDIVLERQVDRGMLGGFAGEALLYVGGVVAATMTRKWVEEVLWPRVKPTLEKHSHEVFDLLVRIAEGHD